MSTDSSKDSSVEFVDGVTPPLANTSLETFDGLRGVIHARYDGLSGQLQRVARIALKDPNSFALGTVTEVAQLCEVQPSTLVRFAKEFDFRGFSDLQKVFRLRLVEGAPALREQIARHNRPERDGADASIGDIAQASIASIQELVRNVDPLELERAIAMMASARHAYVLAQRRAFPVAAYIAYGIWRLERPGTLLDFVGGMVPQQAAGMSTKDILIAVSFEPYAPAVVEVVTDAHIRGIPTLTITDSPLGPIARHSNLSFPIEDSHLLSFRPIAASICLAQMLIAGLSAKLDPAASPG